MISTRHLAGGDRIHAMIVGGLLTTRRDGPPDAQKEARAECGH